MSDIIKSVLMEKIYREVYIFHAESRELLQCEANGFTKIIRYSSDDKE